jgi:hypothetical protein
MQFSNIKTYEMLVEQYNIEGLPNKELWSADEALILSREMVSYFGTNLDNQSLWTKFPFILELIFDDEYFFDLFENSLGEYIGNRSFAEGLLKRARNGEIMWEKDCISLIMRMQHIHDIKRLSELDKELEVD